MIDRGLYRIIDVDIRPVTIHNKNKARSWKYGYNKDYDIIIISKDGTLGEIYEINNVKIGLPKAPKKVDNTENVWEPHEYPKTLSRLKSIFDWNKRDNGFKAKWVDYIEREFNRREEGHWFMNNKVPTYITGPHYMYLQWTKIDVGKPEFREANRIFFIFWAACVADTRDYNS